MPEERFDEKDVFNQARQFTSPDERMAYLQKACGADSAALDRILALLRAYDQEKSFLEASPVARGPTVCEPRAESAGTVIGPYKLLEEIGEGGFGMVFMAEQTQPVRRKVALKVLKPGMDTRQVVARFEAERQALAIMDHPNIAKVFDGGVTASGRPYFVMELVKGVPINTFCDQNHLMPRHRLELFITVCHAVQHAHQKGIIHRDLKPTNILVTMHDVVPIPKIIDFGIAKALGNELTDKTLFTGFAQMVGTPIYMSPEQAGQSGFDIDTRSDIYSLGVLLYELLTGTTPFDKARFKQAAYDEILRIIREEEPPRPSTRLSESKDSLPAISAQRHMEPAKLTKLVRGELDWIVMKSLEKDRNRRYETANGFAMDLQRYLADEPVLACPPSAGYRLRKFARRNRIVLQVSGLVFVLLVGGVFVSAWQAWRASNAEKAAVEAEHETREALNESKQHAQQLKQEKLASERLRYVSDMRLAQYAAEQSDFIRLNAVLASHRPQRAGDIDLRGFEWYYLDRLSNSAKALTLKGQVSDVKGLAYSPDGRQLVSAAWDLTAGIWDPVTGKKLRSLKGHTFVVHGVAFSPDGRLLASASGDNTVRIWDPATGHELHKLEGHTDHAWCVAFSGDGRRLASGSDDGTIKIWDPSIGAAVLSIKAHAKPIKGVAFSPDARLLASGSVDTNIQIWEADTGKNVRTLKGHTQQVRCVAFSSDGRLLASSGFDSTVRLWDPAAGNLVRIRKGHTGNVHCVAFSRDGAILASASQDKTVKIWSLTTGSELRSLRGHTDVVTTVVFSPDQRHLASASSDQTIKIWDASATQEDRHILKGHSNGVWAANFSSDGRRLASVSPDNTLRLWDVSTGKVSHTLPLNLREGSIHMAGLAFSRDGQRVATGDGYGTITIWDPVAGRELLSFKGHANRIHCVAFNSDGRWLASTGGGEKTIKIWDVGTGKNLRTLGMDSDDLLCVAFSPDGRWLASSVWDKSVRLWDPNTGQLMHRLDGHTMGIFSVAFSADSRRLASAGIDHTIKVWDLDTLQELFTLTGHSLQVHSVAFSPDGRRLASAGKDKTVRFWDPATGQELLTFKDHSGSVQSVAFSPDGRRLVSASDDKTIRILDATPRE